MQFFVGHQIKIRIFRRRRDGVRAALDHQVIAGAHPHVPRRREHLVAVADNGDHCNVAVRKYYQFPNRLADQRRIFRDGQLGDVIFDMEKLFQCVVAAFPVGY